MSTTANELETITVTLRKQQVQSLRALAEERATSLDALVQDGVDHVLTECETLAELDEDEPLLRLIGMATEGPTDLSSRHDEHFGEQVHWRRS